MEHPGVNCDSCNQSIKGFRYKCLECDDFDLCQLCESDYHSGHLLCRFANPITQSDREFLRNINDRRPRDKPFLIQGYHDDEKCNVCGSDYVLGFLYKCVDCPNFNVCRRCEKRESRCVAGKPHLLVRFADPLSLNFFNKRFWQELLEIRSTLRHVSDQAMPLTSGLAIHDGAKCDACNNKIVGLRFKCLDCPEFDLCSYCEPKMVHTGHLLVRIGQPIELETQAQIGKCLQMKSLNKTHGSVGENPSISSCWTKKHSAITCDNCQNPIHGFRYKCLDCRHFDLCSFCQKKGSHTEHVMIRFTEPLSQNPTNQAFMQAIKKLKRPMGSVPKQEKPRTMWQKNVIGSSEGKRTAQNVTKNSRSKLYSNHITPRQFTSNVNQNPQGSADAIQICTVCYTMPSDIILLDCGHLCICSNCIISYSRSSQQCPICRRPVTSSHRASHISYHRERKC